MNTKEVDEGMRTAWPTIRELLEKEVIYIIRQIKEDPLRAGAMASAGLALIDAIDSRIGVAPAAAQSHRVATPLRTQ